MLERVDSLAGVPVSPPYRRHRLSGNRAGQFAIDLLHPYRLIMVPYQDPIPVLEDGGVDISGVIAVEIVEIVDYH